MSGVTVSNATILAGTSLSNSVDVGVAVQLYAIICPANWTSAGGLCFQASADNITFYPCYLATGKEVNIAVIPGCITMLPTDFARAIRYVKLRSGSAERPVNQPSDRVFGLVLVT